MTASLDQLRTFLAVYRAGSITQAAHLLHMAQPTVTGQVKALERTLGRPLFERRPRGVVPTEAADHLARRLADPVDEMERVLSGELDSAVFSRPVHLGGPAEFLAAKVMPALAGQVADGLQLRVTFGVPDGLLPALARGRLDLVVSTVPPRLRGVATEPLYDEELVLVIDAGRAETLGVPLAAEEISPALTAVPLVAYAEDQPLLRRYWRDVVGARLARPPDLVVPDLRAVLSAVAAGAGATVLPRYLCEEQLDDGRLVAVCEPSLPPLNTLYLARRAGLAPSAGHDRVRERLLESLANH